VHVILPGQAADPHAPSGGDRYDRRVCDGLAGSGWAVRERAIPGAWPRPDGAARASLAGALAAIPDGAVVLLDGLVACAAPEAVCPEAGRLRLVMLVHLPLGDETGLAPEDVAALTAAERQTLRAAAAVVTTSAWAARRVADRHGLAGSRIHVATPGVDPAPLAPGTDNIMIDSTAAKLRRQPRSDTTVSPQLSGSSTPDLSGSSGARLLCVAAVTPLKAQDLLVEALARVADLPWRCDCVGALDRAPTYVEHVRGLAREHGLDDRVQLVGPRTGDALAASYAATDLLVLASHVETYGMALTEALARGIPVVATDVGGVREALGSPRNLPGLLVPPGDPAALAAALRRWLAEPGTRHRLRHAARGRRATLTGWDATVRIMIGVLEQATATGAGIA
jgi:glycosyltransferase involved in cell wall biosynthesis